MYNWIFCFYRFVTSDQIAQLKIYALTKQLDKEKADKKRILEKVYFYTYSGGKNTYFLKFS